MIRLFLAVLLSFLHLVPTNPQTVNFKPLVTLEKIDRIDYYLVGFELLKECESFRATPYWDVNAYRSGYGTKAKHRHEIITLTEAESRALAVYRYHWEELSRNYPELGDRQKAALSVARYNLGSFGPKLRQAIASGSDREIASKLSLYVNVNGEPWAGLIQRRAKEINLLLPCV